MAGKHSQKSSKAPLIILMIAAVIIIGAVIAGVIFFINKDTAQQQTKTQPAAAAIETTSAAEEATQAVSKEEMTTQTTAEAGHEESETGAEHETEKVDIALPVEDSGDLSYFNASFIPNGVVEDTYTGESANLREVFGSDYADGVITFNSDGSFTDTLGSSSVNSGAYAVQDGKIIATYTNDKNMQITVTEWNGDTPAAFYINYGGYNVYFG